MPVAYDFYTGVKDLTFTPVEILPPYDVQVYTVSGQIIKSQKNAMEADLTGLNAGVYIVQYEKKNGYRIAKKVIR